MTNSPLPLQMHNSQAIQLTRYISHCQTSDPKLWRTTTIHRDTASGALEIQNQRIKIVLRTLRGKLGTSSSGRRRQKAAASESFPPQSHLRRTSISTPPS